MRAASAAKRARRGIRIMRGGFLGAGQSPEYIDVTRSFPLPGSRLRATPCRGADGRRRCPPAPPIGQNGPISRSTGADMNTPEPDTPRPGANGRRAALVVILIAFVASATTAMLAFTASHRARTADATAQAADIADLHATLAEWQAQVTEAQSAGHDQARQRLG